MTSEEFGFGTERVRLGTAAKLVSVTLVACVVFVGAMYYLGKNNVPVVSENQQHTVTAQLR